MRIDAMGKKKKEKIDQESSVLSNDANGRYFASSFPFIQIATKIASLLHAIPSILYLRQK